MNKTKMSKTLIAVLASSALLSGAAFAEETMTQKAQQTADNTGSKIDSSMKKVDGFMDDSGITALEKDKYNFKTKKLIMKLSLILNYKTYF